MTNFLNHDPIVITAENDHFELLPKIEIAHKILASTEFKNSGACVVALYGNWGSGKSSFMKTLATRLKDENNQALFFEAWKFEKDHNLAYSLLDYFSHEMLRQDATTDELLTLGGKFFMGLVKGLTITTPFFSFSAKDAVDDVNDEIKLQEDRPGSQYAIQVRFNELFLKAIDSAVLKDDRRIYIFIDDLDRCEPEGVLHLLSAIKNFFTIDSEKKRLIFVVGIDKKAVEQAIRTKYSDILKSEEYLEKIFDFSFELPTSKGIDGLFKAVFSESKDVFTKKLSEYFVKIGFTLPRHVKKVLNNYQKLKFLNDSGYRDQYLFDLSFRMQSRENFYQHIFLLSLIIVKMFHRHFYDEIRRFSDRVNTLGHSHVDDKSQPTTRLHTISQWVNPSILNESFQHIVERLESKAQLPVAQAKYERFLEMRVLFSLFLPAKATNLNASSDEDNFFRGFSQDGNEVQIKMAKYLSENRDDMLGLSFDNSYVFRYFFDLVDRYV